jgi:3-phenylpropionate/trans-cinnamate dioxygenase ferredoxin component
LTKHCVAALDELPVGSMRSVDVEGEPVCLAHADDGGFYAIGDVCTHEFYFLSEGTLEGTEVECPQHGSRFSLKTGKVTGLPAVIPAKTYPVSIEDGNVCIEA